MKNWDEVAGAIRSATAHEDVGNAGDQNSPLEPWVPPEAIWDSERDFELLHTNLAPFLLPSLVKHLGLVRYCELRSFGVRKFFISETCERGQIVKVARGLFTHRDVSARRRSPLAQVTVKHPKAIAALRTAAVFWRLRPWCLDEPLWFATGHKNTLPIHDFAVEWLRWSPLRQTAGVARHNIGGVELSLTSPARTVADFFAHRRRVKPGEPSEMLAAFRSSKHWNETALLEAADACRVTRLVKSALRFP